VLVVRADHDDLGLLALGDGTDGRARVAEFHTTLD